MRRLILAFFAAAAIIPPALAARPLERGPGRPSPDATASAEPEAVSEQQPEPQRQPEPQQREERGASGFPGGRGEWRSEPREQVREWRSEPREQVREWRRDRTEQPRIEQPRAEPVDMPSPVDSAVAAPQDVARPQLPRGDGMGRTLERAIHGQTGRSGYARDSRRDYRRDDRYDTSRGAWSRDWRRDSRYDWRGHRERNRFTFELSPYWDPYGLRYRRTTIGWNLRPSYYRASSWISDPYRYRLPPAYGPYRWVRYYDDAVLVNIYDGRIADVIYNFFW